MTSYQYFADDLGTDVVTLVVGPSSTKFVVHRQLLVSKSHYFKSALSSGVYKEAVEGVITFDEDDPRAFRVLISWLYRERMPMMPPFLYKPDFSRVKPTTPEPTDPDEDPPSPTVPTPITRDNTLDPGSIQIRDPSVGSQDSVVSSHLSAHSPYSNFSPEELRLADYAADPARQDTTPRTPRPEDLAALAAMNEQTRRFEEESNAHQETLVRLIALAERLCWDALFNAAVDAYLDGERRMYRAEVPLHHLEVAYSECSEGSPLRRMFCDMAHFGAKNGGLGFARYLELAHTHEDFLADLFARLDSPSQVPPTNPLYGRSCVYHNHLDEPGRFCS